MIFRISHIIKQSVSKVTILGVILIVVLLLNSCQTSRPLADGEYYLKSNKVKLEFEGRLLDRETILSQTKKLIRQTPSPFKLFNVKTYRRNLIIHDSLLTIESQVAIQNYLINKKGFYNAEVELSNQVHDNFITNTYVLRPKERYTLRSIKVESNDKEILKSIDSTWSKTNLHIGVPIEEDIFNQEKDRIANDLRNRGYWKFSPNFIKVEGDSSDHQVDVILIVDQIRNENHKKYYINDINVYTDHSFVDNPTFSGFLKFNDKFFYRRGEKFTVRPKSIDHNIFYKKGSLLKRSDRLLTLRGLQRLSALQFVYPEEKQHPTVDSLVDISIFILPKEKLWTTDLGINLFYSVLGGSTNDLVNPTQNFLGLGANTSLTNHNIFGGGERYSLNLDGTLELDIDSLRSGAPWANSARSTSYAIGNQLDLPRFRELFPTIKLLDRINVFPDGLYNTFRKEATTEVDLSYTYTNIRNAFSSNSFNASWSYQYKPNISRLLRWKQTGINVFTTDIDSIYQKNVLDNSPARAANFDPNVSVGLLFREISYINTGKIGAKSWSHNFLTNVDFSGLEILLANGISNAFREENTTWKLGKYDFAKYLKFEINNRFYKHFNEKEKLVFRADVGFIIDLANGIPFYTQFLSGGPNSIRAWQLRQLGPDIRQLRNPEPGVPFFQSGDFKIEFSTEYRFKILSFFEGAAFVDAGNLYSINSPDPDFNNIGFDFYKSLAVGVGYGVRLDFNYFLIRFDLGYKMLNPYSLENGSRFVLFNKDFNGFIGNANVAINYPF